MVLPISQVSTLALWTRRATKAASKFPCLTIDGNADSRGTSAVFQTVTSFYAVCAIFPSNSFVFYQIKWFFCYGNGIWPPFFFHFCHFLVSMWNLCSKGEFLVSKLLCFAISLDAILPE
jgi:hypothetical protein